MRRFRSIFKPSVHRPGGDNNPEPTGFASAETLTYRQAGMETYRITVSHVDLDGHPLDIGYADIFIVVREGDDMPGTTDWEVQINTPAPVDIALAPHDLALGIPDGTTIRGRAIVRHTDGHRHLFRGDSELAGFERSDPTAG